MPNQQTKSAMIGLISETNIHVGVGQSAGALDLPIARESTTDYPFVPGSGVKGAMLVWAKERAGLQGDCVKLFGKPLSGVAGDGDSGGVAGAGNLLLGDARLLLLPVRSLSSAFKWVTCPQILTRLMRDLERGGVGKHQFPSMEIAKGHYLGAKSSGVKIPDNREVIVLEELEYVRTAIVPDKVMDVVKMIIPDDSAREKLADRLIVLHDDDFAFFAKSALPIMARNVLEDDSTKRSKNLWYEESLPPETIMHILLGERSKGAVSKIVTAIDGANYIQMGGNETIGHGWFKMAVVGGAP